jgi:hypothetical protein
MESVMKRSLWALAVLVLCLPATLRAEATFRLGFEGPPPTAGADAPFFSTLTHSGDPPGAQGWSIGVTADNAAITSITLEGLAATAHESGGFALAELATGRGNEGAVSSVVLHLKKPVTLQPNGTERIARLELSDGPLDGPITLRYADGLTLDGATYRNLVVQNGRMLDPVLDSRTFPSLTCGSRGAVNLGFSAAPVSSPVPFDGILGGPSASGTELVVDSEETEIYANLISQLSTAGAQGWTLSIALEGDGRVVAATTDGTSAAVEPAGYRRGGFELTEIVDPGRNGGVQGTVSAVLLSFDLETRLPAVGTESVLKIRVQPFNPQKRELAARLIFRDSLVGTGQPVLNLASADGGDLRPCNVGIASVTLKATVVPFLRGDANGNGIVTISDVIHTLGGLFLGLPGGDECKEAQDANDDGTVNISDPLQTIGFLFQGGAPIPAPYPACGNDPSPDGLRCEEFSFCP